MIKILSALFVVAPLLMAQDPGFHFEAFRTSRGGHESLQTYLSLSDEQVRQLGDLRRDQFERMRPAMEQLAAKQRELDQALEGSSPDAALVGRLTIEMQQLRQSMPGARDSLREQALAILSSDQREKITKLNEALQLHPTAIEAASLNLVDTDFPPLPGLPGGNVWFGGRTGTFEARVPPPDAKTIFFRGRPGADPAEVGGDHIIIREQIVK